MSKSPPERVAAEICRLVRKLHGVRQAEVSNMVERERLSFRPRVCDDFL